MMPMPPNNALNLMKQHNQDILREAEADRLYNEAKRGAAHPTAGLLAPLHAAMAAIARIAQQRVSEPVKPLEKPGAELSAAKSVAG
jgi:hypothetical protein